MVDRQIAAHLRNYEDSGAGLIMGAGHFVAPKTLEVRLNDGGTRVLTADQVFLNVGTHATVPDVPGLQAASPLTNIEARSSRSEEHTSELQSPCNLVCRLLLEKKKKINVNKK